MAQKDVIKIFESKKVCTVRDDESEKWYLSTVAVIEILTKNERLKKY